MDLCFKISLVDLEDVLLFFGFCGVCALCLLVASIQFPICEFFCTLVCNCVFVLDFGFVLSLFALCFSLGLFVFLLFVILLRLFVLVTCVCLQLVVFLAH